MNNKEKKANGTSPSNLSIKGHRKCVGVIESGVNAGYEDILNEQGPKTELLKISLILAHEVIRMVLFFMCMLL